MKIFRNLYSYDESRVCVECPECGCEHEIDEDEELTCQDCN
jgi:hypothetical protein